MGKFITIILLFLTVEGNGQEWIWQNTLPTGNGLKSLCFTDSSHGWIVGNNGTILKLMENNEWKIIYNDTIRENINSAFFLNDSIGWLTSAEPLYVEAGNIFKTENGGESWTLIHEAENKILDSYFLNKDIGWAVGNGSVIKTTNGGDSWENQISNSIFRFNTCYFVDTSTGWVAGNVLFNTSNGGQTWNQQFFGVEGTYWTIKFSDRENGWLLGQRAPFPNISSIVRTTDGGVTWFEDSSGGTHFFELQFIDSLVGYLLDESNVISKTTDGGITWAPKFGFNNTIEDFFFLNEFNGWSIGSNGTIHKTTNGGINWSEESSGIRKNITDLYFLDSLNGWATTSIPSRILRTTNGGLNWGQCYFGGYFMETVTEIKFLNPSRGWAVGHRRTEPPPSIGGGVVMTTYNGGQNWSTLGYPSYYTLQCVFFVDELIGFVGGDDGKLLKTFNGGWSWNDISPTPITVDEIFFIDSLNGWISCRNGDIFKTSDCGNSWDLSRHGENDPIYSLKFINKDIGWAGGSSGLKSTTDGGNTWNNLNGTIGNIYDISFSGEEGFIVGGGGRMKTSDGGETWYPFWVPSPQINCVQLFNSEFGWFAGVNGSILKYYLSEPTTIEELISLNNHESFFLSQNYPNPFNPSTKISWQSPVGGHQTLKVYDVLGREVATLVDEYRDAGSYEVEFQSAVGNRQLASGIYYYQLKVGDPSSGSGQGFVETKKMLILK